MIIKESDKGGSCIIMDSQYYKEKMMEELSDTSTYQELENNIDKKTKKRLVELTKRYDNNLTKKEIKYLTEFEFKESNLYGLPKVHKSEEIKKKIKESPHEYVEVAQPKDLKMWPIIASPSSITIKLSNYLDVLLKPLLRNVKSYIRDTVDFLNDLPGQLEDNVI